MRLKRAYRYVNVELCFPGWFFSEAGEPHDPVGHLLVALGYNYAFYKDKVRGVIPAQQFAEANDTGDYAKVNESARRILGQHIYGFLQAKGIDANILGLALFHWEEMLNFGMSKADAWKESLQFGEWLESPHGTCGYHSKLHCELCFPRGTAPWKLRDPSTYVPPVPPEPEVTVVQESTLEQPAPRDT